MALAFARCFASGGKAVLLNLDQSRIETSEALDLDEQFETYDNQQDAINSFYPERAMHHYDVLTFGEQEVERMKSDQRSDLKERQP